MIDRVAPAGSRSAEHPKLFGSRALDVDDLVGLSGISIAKRRPDNKTFQDVAGVALQERIEVDHSHTPCRSNVGNLAARRATAHGRDQSPCVGAESGRCRLVRVTRATAFNRASDRRLSAISRHSTSPAERQHLDRKLPVTEGQDQSARAAKIGCLSAARIAGGKTAIEHLTLAMYWLGARAKAVQQVRLLDADSGPHGLQPLSVP
jgi:hypothetical protein